MEEKKGPYNRGDLQPLARKRSGDPRLDVIESGPLRGRRAVTLGMVESLRQDAALLARELVGIGVLRVRFARERARSIEHALCILERVASLPVDPASDYRGGPVGGPLQKRPSEENQLS